MKVRFLYKLVFFVISVFFFQLDLFAQDISEYNYVGTKVCKKCHKSEKQGKQFTIWKESIHSNAYKTLSSTEAVKIAKEMGLKKMPTEINECLACHTSGTEVDKIKLGNKFSIEDGVQCETCHGPGSGYKKMKIMKNRELALKKGLVPVYENTEEFCRSCHNPDSPTFSGFDFESMWAKIQHNIPVKKNEK